MGSIPVDGIIKIFQQMYREHWPYEWGAAHEGCVDCSGAFVYAYQQYHHSIAHGSNSIARSYVVELLPISKAAPGMAAFKFYRPGEKGYNLPAKYQRGGKAHNGDLNDYHHIGLVDADPRYCLNAQSSKTGFVRSKLSEANGWNACGYLQAVDYQTEGKPMEKMIVTAPNGKKVRVRSAPGKTAPIIDYLECGTQVSAETELNGWRKIECPQVSGYMAAEFLKAADTSGDGPAYVKTLTVDEYNELCEIRDGLDKYAAKLKTIVGVG